MTRTPIIVEALCQENTCGHCCDMEVDVIGETIKPEHCPRCDVPFDKGGILQQVEYAIVAEIVEKGEPKV